MDSNKLRELDESANDVLALVFLSTIFWVILCVAVTALFYLAHLAIYLLGWLAIGIGCVLGGIVVVTGLAKLFFAFAIYWESD